MAKHPWKDTFTFQCVHTHTNTTHTWSHKLVTGKQHKIIKILFLYNKQMSKIFLSLQQKAKTFYYIKAPSIETICVYVHARSGHANCNKICRFLLPSENKIIFKCPTKGRQKTTVQSSVAKSYIRLTKHFLLQTLKHRFSHLNLELASLTVQVFVKILWKPPEQK